MDLGGFPILQSEFLTVFERHGEKISLKSPLLAGLDQNMCVINLTSPMPKNSLLAYRQFLSSKTALQKIQTLVLKGSRNLPPDVVMGFLNSMNSFISTSKELNTICYEGVSMLNLQSLKRLSLALSKSTSVKWVCIRNCNLYDDGLRLLTPALSRIHLQVLIVEGCLLTDESCTYLASILRAHESRMDTLSWNALLRMPEKSSFHRCGTENMGPSQASLIDPNDRTLTAVSLKGNNLTGVGLLQLAHCLCKNRWLLGLKLSNNHIDVPSAVAFIESLTGHCALQAVLFDHNPGFGPAVFSQSLCEKFRGSNQNREGLDAPLLLLMDRWKERAARIFTSTLHETLKLTGKTTSPTDSPLSSNRSRVVMSPTMIETVRQQQTLFASPTNSSHGENSLSRNHPLSPIQSLPPAVVSTNKDQKISDFLVDRYDIPENKPLNQLVESAPGTTRNAPDMSIIQMANLVETLQAVSASLITLCHSISKTSQTESVLKSSSLQVGPQGAQDSVLSLSKSSDKETSDCVKISNYENTFREIDADIQNHNSNINSGSRTEFSHPMLSIPLQSKDKQEIANPLSYMIKNNSSHQSGKIAFTPEYQSALSRALKDRIAKAMNVPTPSSLS